MLPSCEKTVPANPPTHRIVGELCSRAHVAGHTWLHTFPRISHM
jgi:hypothetical protein